MTMTTVEIQIPDTIKEYVLDDHTEKMRNAMLLYPSIVNESISHGKAAELLEMNKLELIQLYGQLGLPYIDMTEAEFGEEVNMVRRMHRYIDCE